MAPPHPKKGCPCHRQAQGPNVILANPSLPLSTQVEEKVASFLQSTNIFRVACVFWSYCICLNWLGKKSGWVVFRADGAFLVHYHQLLLSLLQLSINWFIKKVLCLKRLSGSSCSCVLLCAYVLFFKIMSAVHNHVLLILRLRNSVTQMLLHSIFWSATPIFGQKDAHRWILMSI